MLVVSKMCQCGFSMFFIDFIPPTNLEFSHENAELVLFNVVPFDLPLMGSTAMPRCTSIICHGDTTIHIHPWTVFLHHSSCPQGAHHQTKPCLIFILLLLVSFGMCILFGKGTCFFKPHIKKIIQQKQTICLHRMSFVPMFFPKPSASISDFSGTWPCLVPAASSKASAVGSKLPRSSTTCRWSWKMCRSGSKKKR